MRNTLLVVLALLAPATTVLADPVAPGVDTDALRTALVKARATNLKRFSDYRVKRVYPHNTYEAGMKNVWQDRDGHLCAIATLVHDSGDDALVEKTAHDTNFVRIADLSSGPIVDWILTSGLTQEEAVMIQQPSAADVAEMEAEEQERAVALAKKLAREDRRLNRNYVTVERTLEEPRIADAGLDVAVARLVARPELAAALIARESGR
jgi:hypothetical protein